jgi:hypothetical protein
MNMYYSINDIIKTISQMRFCNDKYLLSLLTELRKLPKHQRLDYDHLFFNGTKIDVIERDATKESEQDRLRLFDSIKHVCDQNKEIIEVIQFLKLDNKLDNKLLKNLIDSYLDDNYVVDITTKRDVMDFIKTTLNIDELTKEQRTFIKEQTIEWLTNYEESSDESDEVSDNDSEDDTSDGTILKKMIYDYLDNNYIANVTTKRDVMAFVKSIFNIDELSKEQRAFIKEHTIEWINNYEESMSSNDDDYEVDDDV